VCVTRGSPPPLSVEALASVKGTEARRGETESKDDIQRKKPKTFVQISMLLLLVLVARMARPGPIDLLLPILPFFLSFLLKSKREK